MPVCESDPLETDATSKQVRLLARGRLAGVLSRAGQAEVDALRRWAGANIRARVHEIYEHAEVADDGRVRKRSLVVLPTLRIGAADRRPGAK